MSQQPVAAGPLTLPAQVTVVPPEWIDYNGHMSEGYYALAFSYATDALMNYVGMDEPYRTRTGGTIYTAESHITYVRELHGGDAVRFTTQLLDFDEKRMHVVHSLFHGGKGYLAGAGEYMLLHVNQNIGRVAPMGAEVLARVKALAAAHAALPRPEHVGRTIGIRR